MPKTPKNSAPENRPVPPEKKRRPPRRQPGPAHPGSTISPSPRSTVDAPPKVQGLNAHYVLFALILAVFAGCFIIIRPYINILLLALILAFVTGPVNERIETALGGRRNTAAFLSCVLLTVVVIIPLLLILVSLVRQGAATFSAMHTWFAEGKYRLIQQHPMVVWLYDTALRILPDIRKLFPGFDPANLQIDKAVMNASAEMGRFLLNQSGRIASDIGTLIVRFCLLLFSFFFFVRDETLIVNRLLHLIPMTRSQEEQIIGKIKEISRSALLGTFVTSLAQGVAGGLAFTVCGLPGLFWGMVMTFASLIPVVGTALIWGPASLYLLAVGHPWKALFMGVWCVVVVGGIDNFVRPIFMKNGADMNTLMIFFSIMGGINTFGLLGLLYGPLLFGLALVLLYIYTVEFGDYLTSQDQR